VHHGLRDNEPLVLWHCVLVLTFTSCNNERNNDGQQPSIGFGFAPSYLHLK
jgi:hypothetical protein